MLIAASPAFAADIDNNLTSVLPCRPAAAPCVSTASFAAPANYLAPWSFAPDTPESAAKRLVAALGAAGARSVAVVSVDSADGGSSASASASGGQAAAIRVTAELPLGSSDSGGDVDDVAFVLRGDGIALFRAERKGSSSGGGSGSSGGGSSTAASWRRRLSAINPPFCVQRGCISGPAERGKLTALRDDLGWAPLEPLDDGDAVWVQILLH
jgi:hypothetical protein